MMIIVKLGPKWYAREIDLSKDDEIDNIEEFVANGEPVLLIDDLAIFREIIPDDALDVLE